MKPNVILIGFDQIFNKKIGMYLADKLDMFFVDVEELIEYNLINSKEALLKCGRDYIEKEERKTVRSVSEYENTIASISYDIFLNNKHFFEGNNIKILLRPKKVNQVEKIALEDRITLLLPDCDYYIDKSTICQYTQYVWINFYPIRTLQKVFCV